MTSNQMIINQAMQIQGWTSENELLKILEFMENIDLDIIVELGSWKGRSIVAIGLKVKSRELSIHSVDHFLGDSNVSSYFKSKNKPVETDVIREFEQNIKKHELDDLIIVHKGFTEIIGRNWDNGKIDLLFIDSAHDFRSVRNDYLAWEKHVKEGGYILFHDSTIPFKGPTVVTEIINNENRFELIETIETLKIFYKKKDANLKEIIYELVMLNTIFNKIIKRLKIYLNDSTTK